MAQAPGKPRPLEVANVIFTQQFNLITYAIKFESHLPLEKPVPTRTVNGFTFQVSGELDTDKTICVWSVTGKPPISQSVFIYLNYETREFHLCSPSTRIYSLGEIIKVKIESLLSQKITDKELETWTGDANKIASEINLLASSGFLLYDKTEKCFNLPYAIPEIVALETLRQQLSATELDVLFVSSDGKRHLLTKESPFLLQTSNGYYKVRNAHKSAKFLIDNRSIPWFKVATSNWSMANICDFEHFRTRDVSMFQIIIFFDRYVYRDDIPPETRQVCCRTFI